MSCRHFFAVRAVLLLLMTTAARANEWISPDGKVAFQELSASRFVKDPNAPAPLLVHWVANDGITAVGVAQVASPVDAPLEQAGLEKGTLSQFPRGRIVSSTTASISGVPVYTIVAAGPVGGAERFVAQVIVAFNGQVYKLMMSSPGDPSADAELGPMLRSLRIVDPSPRPPAGRPGGASGTQDLSVKFAEWGWLALLAALTAFLFRKKRSGGAAPPSN